MSIKSITRDHFQENYIAVSDVLRILANYDVQAAWSGSQAARQPCSQDTGHPSRARAVRRNTLVRMCVHNIVHVCLWWKCHKEVSRDRDGAGDWD